MTELAKRRGRSLSDLIERLAENARRQDILKQYEARMTELLESPEERAAWQQETTDSELNAADRPDHAQAAAR